MKQSQETMHLSMMLTLIKIAHQKCVSGYFCNFQPQIIFCLCNEEGAATLIFNFPFMVAVYFSFFFIKTLCLLLYF